MSFGCFCCRDDFQPEPAGVSKTALKNFVKVADIAFENDLGLDVTFFTGHMSGPIGARAGCAAAGFRLANGCVMSSAMES